MTRIPKSASRICAALVALSALAAPALAAQTCGARDLIVDRLKMKYHESHRASGLGTDTKMVEIWASPESGSWTILITQADGQSCIAAAGQNWLELDEAKKVAGTAS